MVSLTVLRYPLADENLLDAAEKNAKYILTETEKAVAADPTNASARSDLSISYNDVGRVLRESGKAREAIIYHERALEISEKLIAETTTSEYESNATQTRMFLAQAQVDAGDYAAALSNLERCAEEYEKDLAESPDNAVAKDALAAVYKDIGKSLVALKQPTRASEFFDRAVPLAEEAARKSLHNARIQTRLAKAYFESGRHWKQFAGDEKARAKSCELLQKSFDVWDGLRQKGILSKFNAARPDEVSRELSACR
jgi:tetratricopeptide (TPR) repeat protein